MDKFDLLETRKAKLFEASKDIRKKIDELIDEAGFVELDRYSCFSKNEFYDEQALGEGVITGYATLNDVPVYVVAQNAEVLNGGLSLGAANKICKCLDKALVSDSPVIYLLSSLGIQAGEGLKALEGVARVLRKMQELKGEIPQIAVAVGDVLGSSALFAASCDYTYMLPEGCVSYASPFVLSAKSGKSVNKAKIGGAESAAENGLTTFAVQNIAEVKDSVSNLLNILPNYGGIYLETDDDLNRTAPNLNEKACAECLINAVFDKDYAIELGKGFAPEIVTVIGRIGGYSSAAIIFNGENGVELNSDNIDKIQNFIYYASDNGLPVVTFVNTLGIEKNLETANSTVMKKVSDLVYALTAFHDTPKINVIYGKAIGLGYTLFASREMGNEYSYAFANARISVFDSEVGAQIEFAEKGGDLEKIKANYEEQEQDAMNAAQGGFIDNVIEPACVRQYLIAALQSLVR